MFKFRLDIDFLRAFVSYRSNYSMKCTKVLSKMLNPSLIDNGYGTHHFTQNQGINTAHFTQCAIKDKSTESGEKWVNGTLRENDSREGTVDDLHSPKTMLKNIFECRNQRISGWLIEKKVSKLCKSYYSLSSLRKNEFLEELTKVGLSQYLWLFIQIGIAEKGARYLVDIRENLINLIAKKKDERCGCPELHELNVTLRELLSIWFSHNFLELERITWKSSNEILQKITKYERVHPVINRADLMRRLGPYRRCFVFLHRSMPGEPIIMLHVALMSEISNRLTDILSPDVESPPSSGQCDAREPCEVSEDPSKIRAAVFYSLSLAQIGLNGIGLSYDLIRRVGQKLQSEFPGITKFSTLSPIYHFKTWFLRKLEKMKSGHNEILFPEEVEKLQNYFNHSNYLEELHKVLSSNNWVLQETLCDLLREPLVRLCARYLYLEKTARGDAIDSAASVHLKNGAVMWRINWRANPYERGLNGSFGIMVNYRYYLDKMEIHGREYLEDKKIAASEQVTELVKSAERLMLNSSCRSKI